MFSGGGAVADERQLLLHLRFRLRFRKHADVVAFGEALRHYSDLCLVVCQVLRVHRQPPVVPPAAVATVTVAVHACFAMTAHQKRGHGVRRARRGDQEGFATLSSCVGPHFVLAPDVAGERPPVGLIEEGVNQRVDSGGDVAHPDEDVEEVVEQRLVAGAAAQDEGDVGDEEGTPHDEEEEEDDSQDLEIESEERTKVKKKKAKRDRRGEERRRREGKKKRRKEVKKMTQRDRSQSERGKNKRRKDNKTAEEDPFSGKQQL